VRRAVRRTVIGDFGFVGVDVVVGAVGGGLVLGADGLDGTVCCADQCGLDCIVCLGGKDGFGSLSGKHHGVDT